MPEKFDFSKIEDQQKYDKLSEENQIDIVSEEQEEVEKIKEITGENAQEEEYLIASELVDEERSKEKTDAYIKEISRFIAKEKVEVLKTFWPELFNSTVNDKDYIPFFCNNSSVEEIKKICSLVQPTVLMRISDATKGLGGVQYGRQFLEAVEKLEMMKNESGDKTEKIDICDILNKPHKLAFFSSWSRREYNYGFRSINNFAKFMRGDLEMVSEQRDRTRYQKYSLSPQFNSPELQEFANNLFSHLELKDILFSGNIKYFGNIENLNKILSSMNAKDTLSGLPLQIPSTFHRSLKLHEIEGTAIAFNEKLKTERLPISNSKDQPLFVDRIIAFVHEIMHSLVESSDEKIKLLKEFYKIAWLIENDCCESIYISRLKKLTDFEQINDKNREIVAKYMNDMPEEDFVEFSLFILFEPEKALAKYPLKYSIIKELFNHIYKQGNSLEHLSNQLKDFLLKEGGIKIDEALNLSYNFSKNEIHEDRKIKAFEKLFQEVTPS